MLPISRRAVGGPLKHGMVQWTPGWANGPRMMWANEPPPLWASGPRLCGPLTPRGGSVNHRASNSTYCLGTHQRLAPRPPPRHDPSGRAASVAREVLMRILIRLFVALLVLSPALVSSQAGSIPTPASVLGFEPGADFKLATYDQVVNYFQKVDAVSDRMTMVQAGRTSQGRPFWFALISSKENLAKIDR